MHGKSKPLSVRGLTHSYGGVAAVENVSFEIAPGEIAALLHRSVNTVEAHRASIKKKLKVQTSTELAKLAFQHSQDS